MKNYYDPSFFKIIDKFISKQECFSHEIFRVKKINKDDVWFFKIFEQGSLASSTKDAIESEVIVQEFIRLIRPYHPKYRAVISQAMSGVISEDVTGEQSFASINIFALVFKLLIGDITNFGDLIALVVYVCEKDFKMSSARIDAKNRAVKIDSNEAFISVPDKTLHDRYKIFKKDILNLPLMPSYTKIRFNWLTLAYNEINAFNHNLLWGLLSYNKRFRKELFETMLRLVLLPDNFHEHLINHYSDNADHNKSRYTQFKRRKEDLKEQLLQIPQFIDYVKSDQARQEVEHFLKDIQCYKMKGQINLATRCGEYCERVKQQFYELRCATSARMAYGFSKDTVASILCILLIAVVILRIGNIIREINNKPVNTPGLKF